MKKIGLSLLFSFMLLGILTTTAFANPTIDQQNEQNFDNPTVTGDENHNVTADTVVVEPTNDNANDTGTGVDVNDGSTFDEVIKSDQQTGEGGMGQRTHGMYHNNTNSCASCHQTHTASSKNLLFADSVYQTCASCHDGTLGFYNVFETGRDYFASETTGGSFGGSHAANMSVHLATGAVAIKAAPGGNPNGEGSWTGSFSCASCHAPHGSYAERLLHYNPNNMGNTPVYEMLTVFDVNTRDGLATSDADKYTYSDEFKLDAEGNKIKTGGSKAVGAVVDKASYDLLTDKKGLFLVKGTKTALGITPLDTTTGDTVAIAVFENGKLSKKPWLYGYDTTYVPSFTKHHYAYLIDSVTGKKIQYGSAGVYFKYEKGYVYETTAGALDNAVKGSIARAYTATLQLNAVNDPNLPWFVTKHNPEALWSGFGHTRGEEISVWCSTCHTDYLAKTSRQVDENGNPVAEGTFSTAYRHTTESNSYTCLRCHYAHGSDATIMLDANSETIFHLQAAGKTEAQALEYMMDQNPSSALKKFTNMAGCWACHNSSKAATLKNTDKVLTDKPSGMITDPARITLPPTP